MIAGAPGGGASVAAGEKPADEAVQGTGYLDRHGAEAILTLRAVMSNMESQLARPGMGGSGP
jgi:hypothetical protein